jgi:hypothetical protein
VNLELAELGQLVPTELALVDRETVEDDDPHALQLRLLVR